MSLERRLRRIETRLAPSRPRAATILHLQPSEDAAPHIAARVAAGSYRDGWPLLIVRAAWSSGASPSPIQS
jgi:hypothetical protein